MMKNIAVFTFLCEKLTGRNSLRDRAFLWFSFIGRQSEVLGAGGGGALDGSQSEGRVQGPNQRQAQF